MKKEKIGLKIMNIDWGHKDSTIIIIDDSSGTIRKKTYTNEEIGRKGLLQHLYYMIRNLSIDKVFVETNGYGILAYDFLSNTDIKDKVRVLKNIRKQ
jgi:hypothetical protein